MTGDTFAVTVSAGSLRAEGDGLVVMPHSWTAGGVAVEAPFTGAHVLHLAVAGCVLNDLFREGRALGVTVRGVRVRAAGGFDTEAWTSTGVTYCAEVDAAEPDRVDELLARVDEVAEIPRALRAGFAVGRSDG